MLAVVIASTIALWADNEHGTSAPPRRLNVILLLADDLRADAVHALGGGLVQTPSLDRLASQSVVFRNAYILGSNSPAVCLPSRNMLLSGRAYFRWHGPYAAPSQPNLPDWLRNAGMSTYHHGKRGNVAIKIQERFEVNRYLNDDVDRRSGEPGKKIVDDAIEFLTAQSRDRPFFMYLAFANPHDPKVAAERYRRRYRLADIPLPNNFLPRHPFDNGELDVRDEKLARTPRHEDEIRAHWLDYLAVISGLDENIGRLLDALVRSGLDANTIVIFASDNGLALGSHGLMGKQSLYDHSAKVPLLIRQPGVPAGATNALVYLHDVFPTLADLEGLAMPPALDGVSLKPILVNKNSTVRERILLTYREVQRGLRDDRHKLIVYPKIGRVQLFDLERDPDERNDLSQDPSQADRIKKMFAGLTLEQRKLGDPLSIKSLSLAP